MCATAGTRGILHHDRLSRSVTHLVSDNAHCTGRGRVPPDSQLITLRRVFGCQSSGSNVMSHITLWLRRGGTGGTGGVLGAARQHWDRVLV